MDSEKGDKGKGPNISEASKTVLNDVLTDWNAARGLCKEKETAVSSQTSTGRISAPLTQKPESKGTKDPSSSQIREVDQTVKPSKKGDSRPKKWPKELPREICVKSHQWRKVR